MRAAIDLGNTRIKIGYFERDKLIAVLRFDEMESAKESLKNHKIIKAIFSSVTLTSAQINSEFNFITHKIILDKNTPLPIKNLYKTPQTLGYDRLAAAVGATTLLLDTNILIIDLGTAIKYDFVTENKEFLGGIISPGRKMRYNALHTYTKKLPLLDISKIPEILGTNTEECMASGVLNGIVAEINGIIEKYAESYSFQIIICGGDAVNFESQIKYPTFAAPNLILEGLNRILYYNVKNT